MTEGRSSIMSFTARRLLTSVAAAAIAILALRTSLGPFRLVNSPFTTENILWLAILGLLSLVPRSTAATESGQFPRVHLTIALCLITLAFARNLTDPFLSDDYIILSGPAFTWNAFLAALHNPGGDGSFRPLGTLYYQFVKSFAGTSPLIWHSIGLALHLLNAALVFLLAWKLWRDRTSAIIASLVFGINGTRPEAALWTAGNCDLLASACVLGSIILARNKKTAQSLALVAAGILFKESAYAMPLIALFILWPALPIRASAVCAALFTWRWHLFHGPGGYIDPTTGHPAILALHPLTAAKGVFLRIWDILLVPVNWDAPISWWLPFALTASLLGILYLAATGRRKELYLIPATCCAVLPAIHLALIGQSALGSRILYLAAAPFALLIGSLVVAADKRTRIVSAIMLAGMTGVLENNLNAWHEAAVQAQKLCSEAGPPQSAPGTYEGVFLFQNGFQQCVAARDTRR